MHDPFALSAKTGESRLAGIEPLGLCIKDKTGWDKPIPYNGRY